MLFCKIQQAAAELLVFQQGRIHVLLGRGVRFKIRNGVFILNFGLRSLLASQPLPPIGHSVSTLPRRNPGKHHLAIFNPGLFNKLRNTHHSSASFASVTILTRFWIAHYADRPVRQELPYGLRNLVGHPHEVVGLEQFVVGQLTCFFSSSKGCFPRRFSVYVLHPSSQA